MNKKLHIMIWMVLILAFGLLAQIAWWLFYPYNVAEIKSIEIEPVIYGTVLQYKVDYCKYLNIPAVVTRQLIDNAIIFLPSVETNNPVGCHKSDRFIELPNYIRSDTFILRISSTYKINPIREITITNDSNEFKLIK